MRFANTRSATVTPVVVATSRTGPRIRVGGGPVSIPITSNGRTANVTNRWSGTVTPIDLATRRRGTPIPVAARPYGIAITNYDYSGTPT